MKIKCIIFILIFFTGSLYAQKNPKVKDSARLYKKIEKYAKKNKYRNFFYQLIFEPVTKKIVKKSKFQKTKNVSYSKFEGKIIRKIKIVTLEPFGYSETDSTVVPSKWLDKAGNSLHIKTKNIAIKNLLLIKKSLPYDSLLVKESERLIRSQRYIRSVFFETKVVNKDSVDVYIRVLDSWSSIPDFSTSTSRSNFSLREKNFLGTGHEFSNTYQQSLSTKQFGYGTNYSIPNILNKYIQTSLGYNIDLDGNYSKYLDINRNFYSIYTRWAGGITMGQNLNKIFYLDNNQITQADNYKFNYQDYWGGHAVQIFKGSSEANRATNFIISARYYIKNYVEKPFLPSDTIGIYSSEKLYLMNFGISSRKFTQDKYIFNFNLVEDIASGFVYSITSGYRYKNYDYKLYFGAKISAGRFFEIGYLSGNLEYGTFFSNSKTISSTLSFKAIYFTNLLETGKWRVRQFFKPQLIIGNNRLNDNSDRLTLNNSNGISGFNTTNLFGTKKWIVSFQTQIYSPLKALGFRLNPYFNCTLGMLGEPSNNFSYSKLYSQFSLGFILSNDYLVFSNFQFSFSFFPSIPENGNNIFKTNSISTYDIGLQNFEISKPGLIEFQ